jgi:outer membrane biosynthesis protein TonB
MNQAAEPEFSQEFKKDLLQADQWQFIFTNLAIFCFYALMVLLLDRIPVPEQSADDIKKIQDKFAMFVLKVEPKKVETAPKEETGGVSKAEQAKEAMANKAEERLKEKGSSSAQDRAAAREASAASRAASRDKAAAAVANVGALAMLTAVNDGSDEGSSDQVEDLIGQGGVQSANLGKALSNLDGLKAGGQGAGGAGGAGRAGRRGGSGALGAGGSVDDLLSGIGTAESRSLSRKGGIAISKPDQVVGQAAKSANRDINAINAIIREKMGAIQFCFKKELRRDPNLSGKITIKFTVEAGGRVVNAMVVNSNINSSSLEQCLLKTINMLVFKPIQIGRAHV